MRCSVRGLDYLIRIWGPDSGPTVVLLHGILDTSSTFQFLVDSLNGEWRVLAPDWRGHGQTERPANNGWFHDYLADLDVLLDTYLPNQTVNLVGHSLGGNLASVYAGVRPSRVRRMISVDAFAMIESPAENFPNRLYGWLESGRSARRIKVYPSIETMAERLCGANHRLAWSKALYLANVSSQRLPDGNYTWLFDLARQRSVQTIRHLEEWFACWRCITAPSLWIGASEPLPRTARTDPQTIARVLQQIGPDRVVYVANTGHHIQHDAPRELAGIIEDFLNRDCPGQH